MYIRSDATSPRALSGGIKMPIFRNRGVFFVEEFLLFSVAIIAERRAEGQKGTTHTQDESGKKERERREQVRALLTLLCVSIAFQPSRASISQITG